MSHNQTLPPVPELIRIGVGDHAATSDERAYNRMSFTFTAGFPGYHFEFVDQCADHGSITRRDRRGGCFPRLEECQQTGE